MDMKSLSKALAFAAIVATTLLSCTKELEPAQEPAAAGSESQHIEFKAQINEPATKVTLTTSDDSHFSAQWEESDAVSLNAKSGSYDQTKPATWSVTNACFGGDFTNVPTAKGAWTYVAKYPAPGDGGKIPFGSARVQKGNAYNSAYDVMYGTVNYSNAEFGKDDSDATFVIPMERLTGIAYFHIKGGPNEDVVSATLEATGIAADNVTIASNGESVSPDGNTLDAITITFADGTAPKATDLQLWFNVIPGSYSGLKLTVNTATHTTVLNSSKTMEYTAGKLNKAVLSGLTWDKNFEGEWILTGIKGEQAYACGNYISGNNIQNVKEITINTASQVITGEDLDVCKIIITKVNSGTYKGFYTIQDANSTSNYWYAAGSSTNNYLKSDDLDNNNAQFYWSISESEGVHLISAQSNNHNTIKFNTNSGTIFSCYAADSQQASVTLYPYSWVSTVSRTPVSLSFSPASPEAITFGDDFTEPTLVKDPVDAPVTYSVETTPAGIASIDAASGDLTITGYGTITVTASVSDEEHYKPASANYTLTVNEKISDYATAGSSNVTLSATGGTNASLAKVNEYDALKAGTSKNAGAVEITVPANTTNLHLHAAGWNEESVTLSITGATVNPSSLKLISNTGIAGNSPFTLSEGSNVADYYFNIALSNINEPTTLTFTATSGKRFVIWGVNAVEDNRQEPGISWSKDSASASMTDSGNTFTELEPTLQNPKNLTGITYESTDTDVATVEAGVVNIKAAGTTTIKAIFGGNAEYKPQTVSYILTVADNRSKAISFTQPSEGGSFTVSVDNTDITTGAVVPSGKTVTLTATAATGYSFSGWTVEGANAEDASAATTSFIMGNSPVTVIASFTSNSKKDYTITWGSTYNGSSVGDYTSTWNATKDGFTVNMANFNNNQNGWTYVKCGRKNTASVATIITDEPIVEAIKTVTITIDALTADKINSITLYVSSSKDSGWTSAGTFTKATGNQFVTIASPAANKYYKLEFDCASGSSNGLLTLSKAIFSNY